MSKLHYLTVQDILWINLQATKKVQHFSHARLEEATFYQYAYGGSSDLLGQAARFLSGFVKMHPLDAGNEVTAFLGAVTFLTINGYRLKLADAEGAAWAKEAFGSIDLALTAIERVAEEDAHHHAELKPDIRAAVRGVLGCYPETVAALVPATVSR